MIFYNMIILTIHHTFISPHHTQTPTVIGSCVWGAGSPSSLIHRNPFLMSFDETEIQQGDWR